MESVSGRDLTHFKKWYDTPGTPQVHMQQLYDVQTRSLTLTFTQRNSKSDTVLAIPLSLALLDPTTGAQIAPGRMVELTTAQMSLRIDDMAFEPVVSIPRGFSAPISLIGQADFALPTLAMHDDDGVVRWSAYSALIENAVRAALAGEPSPPALHSVTAALIADTKTDPALLGLMLTVPQPPDIENMPQGVTAPALIAALDTVRIDIAHRHADALAQALARTRATRPYAYSCDEVSRRALHHALLALSTYGLPAPAYNAIEALYAHADNMTDRLAALRCATQRNLGLHHALLDDFARRYANDSLVMEKWFALQAESPFLGTTAHMDALQAHPAYDARNPNKLRSVLGVFGMRNWAQFHAADGSGYQYFAQCVARVDLANPYIAARFVSAFERWRRFDTHAQSLQRQALQFLRTRDGVSANVRELTSKLLDE
jgi:aminopeptidase N